MELNLEEGGKHLLHMLSVSWNCVNCREQRNRVQNVHFDLVGRDEVAFLEVRNIPFMCYCVNVWSAFRTWYIPWLYFHYHNLISRIVLRNSYKISEWLILARRKYSCQSRYFVQHGVGRLIGRLRPSASTFHSKIAQRSEVQTWLLTFLLSPRLLWNLTFHYRVHKIRLPRSCVTFRNKLFFNGEELLTPHPTSRLENHPLSVVCDCLFNIFAATFHIWRPSPPSATRSCAMPWWQGRN
jgi:hypothetical protein